MRFDRICAAGVALLAVSALSAEHAAAMPMATCHITNWSSTYERGLPDDEFDNAHNSLSFLVQIIPAPGPGIPDCASYKVSDLTKVDVTITFTTGAFPPRLTGAILVNNKAPNNGPTFTFDPGKPDSVTFDLDAVDFKLPGAKIKLSLNNFAASDVVGWKATHISLALAGDNYFVAPEPATGALLAVGLAGVGIYRRRKHATSGRMPPG